MEQNYDIVEVFESAVTIVRNLPKEGPIKPSDELKLKLYALFKQATHGPNDTPKPRFYQIVEAYKWDAWHKLADMSKEEAMLSYIRELKQIMDKIPKEEADLEESKRFEDILGKKFYDYWFNQWNSGLQSSSRLNLSSSYEKESSNANLSASAHAIRGNDTQSNSSSGSSMSMLEDTQSATGDGYKTPTSSNQNIASQMSDQFALAILRLQHGLDETRKRLDDIESQVQVSLESLRRLENQTFVKQPVGTAGGESGKHGKGSLANKGTVTRVINCFRNMESTKWFYLTYPILVYVVLRAIEKRRSRNSTR